MHTMDSSTAVPILEMRSISKRFGPVPAIEDIAFEVMPGEVHAILGENGAGKSTLVKIICGQFAPSEGQLFFDGTTVETFSPHHARQLGVAMVQQELSVFDHLTVAELMGHVTGQMVATTYSHMNKADNHLREALKKAGDAQA